MVKVTCPALLIAFILLTNHRLVAQDPRPTLPFMDPKSFGTVKPPTPTQKAAIQRGIHESELRRAKYNGLSVIIPDDVRLAGVDKSIAEKLAAHLARLDYVPAQRLAHYKWLSDRDIAIAGWNGNLTSVTPTAQGWLVTLRVRPLLYQYGSSRLMTIDLRIEHYIVTPNGVVRHIEGADKKGGGDGSLLEL